MPPSSSLGFKKRTKHPRVRTPTRADGADARPTRDRGDGCRARQIETRDASSVVVVAAVAARLDSTANVGTILGG